MFSEVFSINIDGFWHEADAFVLFQKDDLNTIAQKFDIHLDQLLKLKSKWENLLLNNRQKRKKPLLDDKIIISWNALLLTGLLSAKKIIPSKELDDTINNLADFLQFKAYQNDRLGHTYKKNTVYINGNLDDYAFTIEAFIQLFNHTQKIEHLQFAKSLLFLAMDLFFDEQHLFFKSGENESIGTIFDIEDNVIPSANAIMSRNLFYIGFIFKNDYFMTLAKEMTNRITGEMEYASAFSEWLANNLIFNRTFEYIVIKNSTKDELKLINNKNTFKIIIDNSLNLPILDAYKNQDKKFQVCNLNSCRIQTNDITEIN